MLETNLQLVRNTFKERPIVTATDVNFVASYDMFLISYDYVDGKSFWYLDDIPFNTFDELLEYGFNTKVFDKTCIFAKEPSAASSDTSVQ